MLIKSCDQTITSTEIMPLLQRYGLLLQLAKEDIIDRAISQIQCTPSELAIASRLWQYQQTKSSDKESQRQLIALAIRKLKLEKFKRQRWKNQVPAYFARRRKQLDRVVYSLVKAKTIEVAREIYFRLIEGEQTFSALKADADDPNLITLEADGWVELGTLHPIIAKRLAHLEVGTIAAPQAVNQEYVIMRLENYQAAVCDRLMHQRLVNELFQVWLRGELIKQNYRFSSS